MGMSEIEWSGSGVLRSGKRASTALLVFLLVALTAPFSSPQTTDKTGVDHYYEPLPQETGAAGLKLMLRRLANNGSPLKETATPGAEKEVGLTLEKRGEG